MLPLTFRNRLGELVDIPGVAATDVKNAFGTMLDRVASGGPVAITRHDAPRAVLVSFEEFESLVRSRTQALDALDALDAEFDGLVARMQTTKAKTARAAAFDASPARLGRAAVKAAADAAPSAPRATRRAR